MAGAAGCLSGALAGLAPKELQPVAEGFRGRQAGRFGESLVAKTPKQVIAKNCEGGTNLFLKVLSAQKLN